MSCSCRMCTQQNYFLIGAFTSNSARLTVMPHIAVVLLSLGMKQKEREPQQYLHGQMRLKKSYLIFTAFTIRCYAGRNTKIHWCLSIKKKVSNTTFVVNLEDKQLCSVTVTSFEDCRLENTCLVGIGYLIKILTQLQEQKNKKANICLIMQ